VKIINFPASGGSGTYQAVKEYLRCELIENAFIDDETCRLTFSWQGPAPQAGQFFMIKPERTGVFLGRPISVALWDLKKKAVHFLIAVRGKGTMDISGMNPGNYAELTGPLGNRWTDHLPKIPDADKPIALIGGGVGIAPLQALVTELPDYSFNFYAGFKTRFINEDLRYTMLGPAAHIKTYKSGKTGNLIIATEDGTEGYEGRIPDFLEPKKYGAVCACGPVPMLKAVARKCKAARVRCVVSMERNMACGVGACLGCAVKTIDGNRRCCADGPIFPAQELRFDE
jgi:NAD(P)H-flavin reductase